LEPVDGIDLMKARRGIGAERALCSGPGKLTQAMAITKAHYGVDLLDDDSPLRLERPEEDGEFEIVTNERVGISRARDLERRFYLKGNPHVSRT